MTHISRNLTWPRKALDGFSRMLFRDNRRLPKVDERRGLRGGDAEDGRRVTAATGVKSAGELLHEALPVRINFPCCGAPKQKNLVRKEHEI